MCYYPGKKKDGDTYPCGKCPECIQRHIHGWAHRIMQVEKNCTHSQFLTLTYATERLPFNERSGLPEICIKDVQDFFKRLRSSNQRNGETQPIKYYCASEYGGITGRPHYHVLLFNSRIDLAQPAWQNGSIHYGHVQPASIYYTFKYLTKPYQFDRTAWHHIKRPKALSSKGLGATYVTDCMKAWHKEDLLNRVFTRYYEQKMHMPRYYRDKIYNHEEKLKIGKEFQNKFNDQLYKMMDSPDFEQLYRDQKQGKTAAFSRMYHSSTQNQKL